MVTVAKLVAIGVLIRWMLELLFVWVLVLPETGIWTCICLTLITMGIEANYINGERIRAALVGLADDMTEIYKKS